MQGYYLITADSWFYAPNGRSYKSVWGWTEVFTDEEALSIKTNSRATNWYARVGSENNHLIIAGCQIHYALKCETEPNSGDSNDYEIVNGVCSRYTRPSNIYIAK